MKTKNLFAGLCLVALCSCGHGSATEEAAVPDTLMENYALLLDTDGNQINCHGGALLTVDSVTYWYGEHRPHTFFEPQQGINCYSTTDFKNWKHEGIVLPVTEGNELGVAPGCFMERPKVVYSPATGKYVLWFHHELPFKGYDAAHYAVATSDSPTGPFELQASARVNPGIYPINMPDSLKGKHPDCKALKSWTDEWLAAVKDGMYVERDLEGGQMSRDMTVYVDDDGKAYHIYSSEDNLTLNIAELNDDYATHTGRYIRIFPTGHNEAPTVLKHNDEYWMITSGCTGWDPNKARMMHAKEMLGEWTQVDGTPFVGEGPSEEFNADNTFGAQGNFIATINGQLVFMADQWRPKDLTDSRYLWLPIHFDANGRPQIPYVQYLTK